MASHSGLALFVVRAATFAACAQGICPPWKFSRGRSIPA
eukprot:CAMPEP_0180335778 /NCGR_PEP_ID=MMETSP0988-20121125/44435_1 /TAXON_ID=697907 /ORGANISM="non described non described, Strain CCMP2293" /LENGTH=38 /DNA_ID= /DNA_START= /DNA_END= /DNA_ORIENTATION=